MQLRVEETPTRLQLTADRATLTLLREEFKFRAPDYWRSPAYQLWKQTQMDPKGPKGWDGYTHLVEWAGSKAAVMFRGHKEELTKTCAELGITITGNFLVSPFVGLTVDDVSPAVIRAKFELDFLQKTCVVNLLRSAHGVIKATVSAGKTAIYAAVSSMVKARMPASRVLYMVPTERLVNQVFKEMKLFLPEWRISQAGGGKKNFDGADMVVATASMLSRNAAQLHKAEWFKSFTVLLVDECHHAPAKTWQTVIRLCPALFRFGASDTVKDENEDDIALRLSIRGLFGPVRATIDVAPLITTGRVARPNLYLIDIKEWEHEFDDLPHVAPVDTPAWCLIDGIWKRGMYKGGAVDEAVTDKNGQPLELTGYHSIDLPDRGVVDVESRWCLLQRAYDVGIIRNKKRNALITEWAQFYTSKGWPTLVVATRTLHVLIIEQLLSDAGMDVTTLTGEDTSKERDETFAWLMAKPGRVLVSPLVKEGVSLPELRAGIVADVVASTDLARQLIGRFIRKKPTGTNEAYISWFIDRQYTSARSNCLRLFRDLEKIRSYNYYYPCAGPTAIGLKYSQADFA